MSTLSYARFTPMSAILGDEHYIYTNMFKNELNILF